MDINSKFHDYLLDLQLNPEELSSDEFQLLKNAYIRGLSDLLFYFNELSKEDDSEIEDKLKYIEKQVNEYWYNINNN